MRYRISLDTDVATIGLWDAATPAENVGQLAYKTYIATIEERARNSQLFFIYTGSDGSFDAAIHVDESPQADWISESYRALPGTYRIRSTSGLMIAGGLEDYTNPKPQITSNDSRFDLPPGHYRIDIFENRLAEEDMLEQIGRRVAPADMERYRARRSGCGLAFLILLLSGGLGFWLGILYFLGGIALSVLILVIYERAGNADPSIQRVEQEIKAWEIDHPLLLLILRREEGPGPSDGFFHLPSIEELRPDEVKPPT